MKKTPGRKGEKKCDSQNKDRERGRNKTEGLYNGTHKRAQLINDSKELRRKFNNINTQLYNGIMGEEKKGGEEKRRVGGILREKLDIFVRIKLYKDIYIKNILS